MNFSWSLPWFGFYGFTSQFVLNVPFLPNSFIYLKKDYVDLLFVRLPMKIGALRWLERHGGG